MRNKLLIERNIGSSFFFITSFSLLLVFISISLYLISSIQSVKGDIAKSLGSQLTFETPLNEEIFTTDLTNFNSIIKLMDDFNSQGSVIRYNYAITYNNHSLEYSIDGDEQIVDHLEIIGTDSMDINLLINDDAILYSHNTNTDEFKLAKNEIVVYSELLKKLNLNVGDKLLLKHQESPQYTEFTIIDSFYYSEPIDQKFTIGKDSNMDNNVYMSSESLLAFIEDEIKEIGQDGWQGMVGLQKNIFHMDLSQDYESNTERFLFQYEPKINFEEFKVIYSTDTVDKIAGELVAMEILSVTLGTVLFIVFSMISILLIYSNFRLRERELQIYADNGFHIQHIRSMVNTQLFIYLLAGFIIVQGLHQLVVKMTVRFINLEAFLNSQNNNLNLVENFGVENLFVQVPNLRFNILVSALLVSLLVIAANYWLTKKWKVSCSDEK